MLATAEVAPASRRASVAAVAKSAAPCEFPLPMRVLIRWRTSPSARSISAGLRGEVESEKVIMVRAREVQEL
nr:hypothetical protein [archaeon]